MRGKRVRELIGSLNKQATANAKDCRSGLADWLLGLCRLPAASSAQSASVVWVLIKFTRLSKKGLLCSSQLDRQTTATPNTCLAVIWWLRLEASGKCANLQFALNPISSD